MAGSTKTNSIDPVAGIVQHTQPDKPKHTRNSTRKVRTGCITCKKRHVKCDEGKPHCLKCLQSRGHCEGYAFEQRKDPPKPGQYCWDSSQVIRHAAPPQAQMQLNLDFLDFGNDLGVIYFDEFVGLVSAPWTSAASGDDLWAVIVPQLARNSDTLRSAAMAIGALSMWHRQSPNRRLRTLSVPEVPGNEGDSHYFNAVAHYCQSLKSQSRHASLQDTVVLSVMLLYFESLRDNRKAALDHVNHGLSLLLALITDENSQHHIAGLAPNPRPLLAALAGVYNHLTPQARSVLKDRIGSGPPLPNLAKGLKKKNHTIESFMVLLSQLPVTGTDIGDVPAVFNSLDDYQESWSAIQKAHTAMVPIMVETLTSSGAMHSKDDKAIEDFHRNLLGNDRIRDFCDRSAKAMEALDVAFQPLFNKIIMTHDDESPIYLRAIHLRLQFLGVHIFDNPPEYIDMASLNARTPLFREYLSVASIALRLARREVQRNPALQMSLQYGLSFHLLVMAFFCRDALLRDEAVGMLRDYPGQDGLWSTRALYALALRCRLVEHRNAMEGTPDEQWARLWRREFVFEDGGDRIISRYMDRNEATGKWELVEDLAELEEGTYEMRWRRQPVTGSGGLLMVELYAAANAEDETHTTA
ncbi:C6 zinc finger domain protein [Colletotrichum sojae]|uniref:C6 zinc finger domain protein n=1 Tax=Colletotrichum sojae TaxID=2175907 RepID=A0A8H6N5B7_9PEZI|nr:C6 zinc finger domain protein [Colletotrichum sojae]